MIKNVFHFLFGIAHEQIPSYSLSEYSQGSWGPVVYDVRIEIYLQNLKVNHCYYIALLKVKHIRQEQQAIFDCVLIPWHEL